MGPSLGARLNADDLGKPWVQARGTGAARPQVPTSGQRCAGRVAGSADWRRRPGWRTAKRPWARSRSTVSRQRAPRPAQGPAAVADESPRASQGPRDAQQVGRRGVGTVDRPACVPGRDVAHTLEAGTRCDLVLLQRGYNGIAQRQVGADHGAGRDVRSRRGRPLAHHELGLDNAGQMLGPVLAAAAEARRVHDGLDAVSGGVGSELGRQRGVSVASPPVVVRIDQVLRRQQHILVVLARSSLPATQVHRAVGACTHP